MPTDPKPLLFVSSTSDLKEERDSIEAVLPKSIEVYRYEQDQGLHRRLRPGEKPRRSPRDHLLDVLESTDLFVGILGGRYGSVYPDCASDPSIVEWEFETACKQEATEVIAYSKARSLSDVELKQQKFLDRLSHFSEGLWLNEFSNLDEFKLKVSKAVIEWLTPFWTASLQDSGKRLWNSTVLAVALTAALVVAIPAATYLLQLTWVEGLGLVTVGALGIAGFIVANR